MEIKTFRLNAKPKHILLFLALGIIFTLSISSSSAADRTVGPGQSYQTIGSAVSAANNGDNIIVYPNANGYNESITINKRLNVRSSGTGTVTVKATGNSASIFRIRSVSGSTINGFTINGTGTSSSGYGIQIDRGISCSILNNIIQKNRYGIYVDGRSSPTTTIDGNTIQNNNYEGIRVNSGSSGQSTTITNNNINNNARDGVYLPSSGSRNITGNIISNNGLTYSSSYGNYNGIRITGGTATISGNTISYNGNANQYTAGLFVTGGTVSVTNNIFTGNYRNGIQIDGGTITITGNTGTNQGYDALHFRGGTNHIVRDNNFSNNVMDGIHIAGSMDDITPATFQYFESNILVNNGLDAIDIRGGTFTNGIHLNQIVRRSGKSDSFGIELQDTSRQPNISNNWYGTNNPAHARTGPADIVDPGNRNTSWQPYLKLRISASDNSIYPGENSIITADLIYNSNNQDTSILYDGKTVKDGIAVSFDVDAHGDVIPSSGTLTDGKTTTNFLATSAGTANVSATVDSETVSVPITVMNLTVISVDPDNGSNNVPTNKTIKITFNGPITAGSAWDNISVTHGNFTVPLLGCSISGNTLTITPDPAWPAGTTYTINIPANAIYGLTTPFNSSFTTVLPTIISVSPNDGATNVPTGRVITVTFSDPVFQGSAWRDICVIYGTTKAPLSRYSISGNILTIIPNPGWPAGTTFTINIPANAVNGLTTPFTSTFTTVPPTITSINPQNGATNVPTNQPITITFSDPVVAGSAYNNISVYYGTTKVSLKYSLNGNRCFIGNILTIIPNPAWPAGKTYTINLPANAINGLTTPFTSTFTTVPPTITSINPQNGATNVPTNQPITITFSDPIAPGSAWKNISVTYNGTTKASLSKYSINGNTLTIIPNAWLAGTTYTINLPANAINGITTPFSSTFTTTAPTITNISPQDGATNVPTNQPIIITFSDPVAAGSAYNNISVTYNDGTKASLKYSINVNTLTIKPNPAWPAGTTYTINLPANAINGITTPFSSTFTTTAPTITSINPEDGATNVPTSQVVTVTFSEPIAPGSDWKDISVTYNGNTKASLKYSISGNTLIFKPNPGWAAGTTYTINLPANAINGLTTPYTSTFTTVPPTITSIDPEDGATDLPTNQPIIITFSDPVVAGSAYNNISVTYNDGTKASLKYSISGNTLTIKPSSKWISGTTYTINIPANAINGLTTPYTSTFTTA